MKVSLRHRPSDKQAYRYLLHLVTAFENPPASSPEELSILSSQLAALSSKGETLPVDEPISIYRLIHFLRLKVNPKMGEIAQYLGVVLPVATRQADFLVDNGYAERLSDPKDGRLVRLTLTDYGRKAHDVIEDNLLQSIRKNLNFLTTEEESILLTLIDKITAGLKKDTAPKKLRQKKDRRR